MNTKHGLLLMGIGLLVLCALVGTASAKTWYVDIHGGADFTIIQKAVNAATAGDSIIVRDGTYTENIDVNKLLTIRSENGSVNCIVNAANPNDHVFEITADYVNISGFMVKWATGMEKGGIYLSSANHCNISENTASNNGCGIYLDSSSTNNLTGNTASNNSNGIFLWGSSNNNTITDNNAYNNICGIFFRIYSGGCLVRAYNEAMMPAGYG